jgi:hypothetical protein
MPIEFYQSYWKIVNDDIMCLYNDFYDEKVNISRINYGIITLLPKIKEASKIQLYIPICLRNYIYK